MKFIKVALLLFHAFVVSRMADGAAVDRYESERQQHTAVINLLDTTNDKRPEDDNLERPTLQYSEEGQEEDYYYYEDEDEDGMSGDYEVEVPRVAMSSKPQDPSAFLSTEGTEDERERTRSGKGKKKAKGKGKKRNPCLKKYKDFCIHGTCVYLRELRTPSCICHPNYAGARCSFAALPTGRNQEGYSRTTALAVIAVVLSSLCLTIIGLLLALRFHKRGAYDVENEEKVKLGLTPNQ